MTAAQHDNAPHAPGATGPTGLKALEARLRQDLAWLELPAKAWTLPHELNGQPVLDVAVIGGGMAGLAAQHSPASRSSTCSRVSGSKYSLSLVSQSVDTVSGFEFTMMVSNPRSRSAIAARTQQ